MCNMSLRGFCDPQTIMRFVMGPLFSSTLMDDLVQTARNAFSRNGIVNISQLAEEIRRRNESDNIALEDIAAELMAQAQRLCAAMEFDGTA